MRTFSARETEWLQELDGIELAGFWRRAIAFAIDWIIITLIFSILSTIALASYLSVLHAMGKPYPSFIQMMQDKDGKKHDFHMELGPGRGGAEIDGKPIEGGEALKIADDIVIPVLYFGLLLWKGKGRTPGKRITKIRVMSVMHRHLSFWHCVERALGYGAAALEGGFGFLQFFFHPYRRCAQDRLAETIVVTEASYQQLQHRLAHPLVPDGTPGAPGEDAAAEA